MNIPETLASLRDLRDDIAAAIAAIEKIRIVPAGQIVVAYEPAPPKAEAKPAPKAKAKTTKPKPQPKAKPSPKPKPVPPASAKKARALDADIRDALHLAGAEGIRCADIARRLASPGAEKREIELLVMSVWSVLQRLLRDGVAEKDGALWRLKEGA